MNFLRTFLLILISQQLYAANTPDPDQLKNQVFPKFLQINLSEQTARLYEKDSVIWESVISSGRESKATQPGIFKITEKNKEWVSTIYKVSMPNFQRFSYSDMGIHAGVIPGYPGSAGCIRLPLDKSEELFELTEINMPVVIFGAAPPFEHFKAKLRAAKRDKNSPYSKRGASR